MAARRQQSKKEMYQPRIISLLGSLTDALPDRYPYMSEVQDRQICKLWCLRITGGEGS